MSAVVEEHNEPERYLIFRIESEIFGTPLLGVREVVQYQEPKPIPNTTKSYLGVINIRGEIVGVFDLRIRFDFKTQVNHGAALMVFDTEAGPIAAVSDGMEGVITIDETHIDRKSRFESTLPLNFLLGIANVDGKLITLIDLARVLDAADVTAIRNERKAS